MNRLDIFADLDHIHHHGLDTHHVTDKSVPVEFELRFNVFLFLWLQSLYCCSDL